MPESNSPSGQSGGQGGSQSTTGGRGGGAGGRGGSGGSNATGGSSAGTGGSAGSSAAGSGGTSSTGGTGGGRSSGGASGGGSGGTGGNAGGSGGSSSADASGSRDSSGQGADSTAPAAPKLSTDVLPIVKANCARSGCHDPMKKEHGMDVSTAAGIVMSWVNRQTADHCKNNATVTRVVPLKPENSFVVTLISTQMYCNEVKRMPPPPLPMLTPDQIKTIRDWISAGAKND
jgi:hypothetical protein